MLELESTLEQARLRPDRRRQAEDLARPRPGALRRQRHHVRRAADGDRSASEMGAALEAARSCTSRIRRTMIYVTHDQTEALTFADQVVVMNDGEIVQIGTPVELFERPKHTFVGHFIGSPGMNVLPCHVENGRARLRRPPGRHGQCRRLSRQRQAARARRAAGIRRVSRRDGIPVRHRQGARCRPLPDRRDARIAGQHHQAPGAARASAIPSGSAHLRFDPPIIRRSIEDGWMVT